MTWDSILQHHTPVSVSTPQTNTTSSTPAAVPTPDSRQEYEILICGLRNVLDRGMVAKGGYRLGESYVFPASLRPRLDESILPSFPKMPSMTMLSCTVTIYLSSSNLVFQPTFQHHRLRTLDALDLDPRHSSEKELSVILSPHGTRAVLKLEEMTEFTDDQTQKCLEGWANLFGTNLDIVNDMTLSLPRLVAVSIKSGVNEVLLQYPTERVFVPVSCKESPSDVGQLDGMGSRNLGFIEDLGAKFAMWSWQEKTRNAIISPAVPKLVQPVSEHTPILAEPRNRLKAGSSAWQQQQLQIQQQQQQQQQEHFLQQQQDALARRDTSDTNRIDYWSYTDPHAYLTSIVLNSCANAEPKGADSPSAIDSQISLVVPPASNKPSKSKKILSSKAGESAEADGWIRKKPKRNTAISPKFNNFGSVDQPEAVQSVWSSGLDSGSMQASDIESGFNKNDSSSSNNQYNDSTNAESSVQPEPIPTDTQSSNTVTNNNSYPIDLPNDDSDMMPGLIDMNSILGLYGAGSDDLGDWGEVTKDDFSFFDEQPRSAPPRPLPNAAAPTFDSQSIQSSIPVTSLATVTPVTSAIGSSDALMSAFSDMQSPFGKIITTSSPMNDDSLFANMDLDLASFAQPTPPSSAIVSLTVTDKLSVNPSGSSVISPSADQFITSQAPQDIGIPTATLQGMISDKDSNHHPLQLQMVTAEQSVVKRSSILVEQVHSPIQSYIPSSFAPLKIIGDYFVDDSKYQAGGRYVYKRLYKRRRSSIPSPNNIYRRESKMLPFYQPGKDQEWIMPVRKEKQQRKLKSRVLAFGINWNPTKKEESTPPLRTKNDVVAFKQEGDNTKSILGKNKTIMSTTAWGISALSLQYGKRKNGNDSSSGDSDSESTSASSDGDSDENGSISFSPRQPAFGKLTKKYRTSSDINSGTTELWSVQGINSSKFVDAILTQSTDHSVGGILLGLSPFVESTTKDLTPTTRITELDSERERIKPWTSAEAYHAEVEYDTPFMPAILSAAPPALVKESLMVQESLATEYFLDAVKTLCEQAIIGDYPFAGSNEATGTSGEITEGESFHVMLARRKTMSDFLHRGVATVPALGDESFRNMMEMKTIIFELFDRLRGNQSDNVVALPVPSDASQDMTMSMTGIHGHHHHSSQSNISPPVIMKGPLTLFQYFTLAEAQQMPSKYGKYQVKKKKPAEPALLQLQPPDIVVGHNEEWLEASPTILRFWEKLSLEPYSSKKNISYFVVFPDGADLENSVSKFWRELSVVYESSLLGKHQPGTLQDYKPGLVPIPLLAALAGESAEARQVRSYVDGCQRLGSILGGISLQRDVHTVIYMVNPFSHGAGYFDLCRCFSIMMTQFRTAAMGSLLTPLEQQRERLVLQLVPIQHVIYPSTFGGYLRFGLKDIAFTVYTKCKLFLERPTYSQNMMARINTYAPSFALAKTAPSSILFDAGQKPNSLPKSPATLHVGYGLSLDGRWLICVWTDHRGEMLEHMALDLANCPSNIMMSTQTNGDFSSINNGDIDRSLMSCLHEIWTRTKVYQKRGSFSWKTVVCKLGLMSHQELQEWKRLISGTGYTAIVAVNIDSPLRLYPHGRSTEYLSSGTPSASGINTPTNSGTGQGTPLAGPSTPLSQSLGLNNINNSTSASTPDISTAPATPMGLGNPGSGVGLNNVGAGLGIAGAGAGGNTASQGGSGSMGGIGGLSGSEVLENGAGQVYAMILNHRIPLIVPRREAGLGRYGNGQLADSDRQRSNLDSKGDINVGDINMGDVSQLSTPKSNHIQDQDQDVDMGYKIKMEEQDQQYRQQHHQGRSGEAISSSSQSKSQATGESDVILPLSTGYLTQVPIQSNSVMREKHSLEALGIEVHLLHLQRTPTTTPSSASSSNTPSASGVSTGALLSNVNSSSPYQQHSTAYHLQRHSAASPSTPGQQYRSSSYSTSQYPGSPLMTSPSATLLGGGQNQTPGNQQQQQQQPNAGTTIKATVAANTTREILKQFHALSYLSFSPVQTNCLPNHLVLVERLSRVLLLVQD
ncbi:mediator of RNA polymerase II transcription subunit 13 [Mortierella sp. AD094]|nr:mediator of RNA polymerase II transcription subunit 13 [Mortierella sp. AD094]